MNKTPGLRQGRESLPRINVLAYYENAKIAAVNSFITLTPRGSVVKLFTAINYWYYAVMPSFCFISLYYLSNYCGVKVNYNSSAVIYCHTITFEKEGTTVNYYCIFISMDFCHKTFFRIDLPMCANCFVTIHDNVPQ